MSAPEPPPWNPARLSQDPSDRFVRPEFDLDGPPAEEPTADARTFARNLRDLFIALQAEGFTERQAILLIGQAIAASQGQGE